MYRQWVPCECNFSYNRIQIFLKLCISFLHGLKMCMWFGYNPCFKFCHFFHFVNFVIFWPQILWKCIDSGYLVSATLHTILYQSFWNFTHVFSMAWRYECGLDIILELIFYDFFHFVNLVIFWPQILWKCIDSGYLVSAIPYTISYLSLCNFAHLFSMVWRCACDLDLILQLIFVAFPLGCHFSIYRRCDINFTEVLIYICWESLILLNSDPWDRFYICTSHMINSWVSF